MPSFKRKKEGRKNGRKKKRKKERISVYEENTRWYDKKCNIKIQK